MQEKLEEKQRAKKMKDLDDLAACDVTSASRIATTGTVASGFKLLMTCDAYSNFYLNGGEVGQFPGLIF